MFIVTGASGKLGRKIVQNLLASVPAAIVGVSVRDPKKVEDFAAQGVRVRYGDYRDAESLRSAWEGVSRLLLVSSNAAATGGDPLAEHAAAIGVARDLGVERIFYTSQVSSSPTSLFPPGRDHAATEDILEHSGLNWTALRHGFYAQSAVMMNARAFEVGLLEAPQDGKVAWTTHDDLAAADVAFLTGAEVIDGPTPPLTGGVALDLADLTALAADILHRPMTRAVVTEENVGSKARAAGVQEGTIAVMLGYYRAARAGEFAAIDPTLARILGRPPQDINAFLQIEL